MGHKETIKMLEVAKTEVEWNYSLDYLTAINEAIKVMRFKEYFDQLYGQGLEVLNWHQNGEPEPFDNFYNSAIEYSEWE